jgi:hypothetical protein
MSDSYVVQKGKYVTAYVGSDAVEIMRVRVIKMAIILYLDTGMKANRAYTPKNMAMAASRIMDKHYPNSRKGLADAAKDLEIWLSVAASAIPIVEEPDDTAN